MGVMCKTVNAEVMMLPPDRQDSSCSDAGISSEGATQSSDEEKTTVAPLPLRVPLAPSARASSYGTLPRRCTLDLRVSLKSEWETNLEKALKQSLYKARSQYRTRVGLCQSLRVLEFQPRSVVMCILPVTNSHGDSLSHVQMLLIQAYCTENSIRILQVRCPENLLNIVKHSNETDIEDEEGGFADEDDDDEGIVLIVRGASDSALMPCDTELLAAYDVAVAVSSGTPTVSLSACC
ncbi:hypothetical protein RvY_06697 [Ramazzottius varieornatus]|uniref:Ribosomal protein L7Ae/L30e/S12e/Gadd45 domain-containing protein n=1 Tax=Ramazzottius varieornatus TaxID=947166 RepID=A0A1D1V911_RAMVA|nr:hypothetical protein RvY_06697 [Ramazzottius varieornatus]